MYLLYTNYTILLLLYLTNVEFIRIFLSNLFMIHKIDSLFVALNSSKNLHILLELEFYKNSE